MLFNSGSYYINFNSTLELVIPTEIPMTEAIAAIEKQPVKVEAKISKCSA